MIDIRDRSQESAMDLIDSCLFDFLSMCRSARASRKYYTYLRMIARDRDFLSFLPRFFRLTCFAYPLSGEDRQGQGCFILSEECLYFSV